MSQDPFNSTIENDVMVVGIQGAGDHYMIWQIGLTPEAGSEEGVYFEYDDQINGGYNHLVECFVSSKGILVSESDGTRHELVFPEPLASISDLQAELSKIYVGAEHVLRFGT